MPIRRAEPGDVGHCPRPAGPQLPPALPAKPTVMTGTLPETKAHAQ
jgi:hypothetical protein